MGGPPRPGAGGIAAAMAKAVVPRLLGLPSAPATAPVSKRVVDGGGSNAAGGGGAANDGGLTAVDSTAMLRQITDNSNQINSRALVSRACPNTSWEFAKETIIKQLYKRLCFLSKYHFLLLRT